MTLNNFHCHCCGRCCRIPDGIARISDTEIALRLGVSRALLDLRLRQLKRPTLRTQITNAKFAAVLAALGKSDVPIAQIAHDCGFPNPKSLGNLFRRRMGVSMSE